MKTSWRDVGYRRPAQREEKGSVVEFPGAREGGRHRVKRKRLGGKVGRDDRDM